MRPQTHPLLLSTRKWTRGGRADVPLFSRLVETQVDEPDHDFLQLISLTGKDELTRLNNRVRKTYDYFWWIVWSGTVR